MTVRVRETHSVSVAPGWTWRAVLSAALCTGALFLLLPLLRVGTSPPEPLAVRTVDTQPAPPPSRPPPPAPPPLRPPPPPPPPPLRPIPMRAVFDAAPVPLELDFSALDTDGVFDVDAPIAPVFDDTILEWSEIDEPPRPTAQPLPRYPPSARAQRTEGYVILEFVVETDGRVADVQVVSENPPAVFAEAALRAVERWRFRPGRHDGRPVAVRVRQRIDFRLDG